MFADAFDVYLEIIRIVDKRVKAALGRDGPDWRVLNVCPACSFEVWGGLPVLSFMTHDWSSLRTSPSLPSDECMPSTAMTR